MGKDVQSMTPDDIISSIRVTLDLEGLAISEVFVYGVPAFVDCRGNRLTPWAYSLLTPWVDSLDEAVSIAFSYAYASDEPRISRRGQDFYILFAKSWVEVVVYVREA